MIYGAVDEWAKAEAAFQNALRLDYKDKSAWYLRGRSYHERNEFPKAKEA